MSSLLKSMPNNIINVHRLYSALDIEAKLSNQCICLLSATCIKNLLLRDHLVYKSEIQPHEESRPILTFIKRPHVLKTTFLDFLWCFVCVCVCVCACMRACVCVCVLNRFSCIPLAQCWAKSADNKVIIFYLYRKMGLAWTVKPYFCQQ